MQLLVACDYMAIFVNKVASLYHDCRPL